jgi:hypothetical protein
MEAREIGVVGEENLLEVVEALSAFQSQIDIAGKNELNETACCGSSCSGCGSVCSWCGFCFYCGICS